MRALWASDDDQGLCPAGSHRTLARRRCGRALDNRRGDAAGQTVELVRSGSRGLFWLEPLVEVATAGNRFGYGPVQVRDVPSCSRVASSRALRIASRRDRWHRFSISSDSSG